MVAEPHKGLERAPLIICDGCRTVLIPSLTSDDSDVNKGLTVSEQWDGECKKCEYTFTVHIKKEVKENERDGD